MVIFGVHLRFGTEVREAADSISTYPSLDFHVPEPKKLMVVLGCFGEVLMILEDERSVEKGVRGMDFLLNNTTPL